MTQLAVAKTHEGIVIGIDSKAVYYSDDKTCTCINNIQKIQKIAPEVIVAIAGSGHGIRLAEALKQHIANCGYWNYSDVVRRSLLFLRDQLPTVQLRLSEESKHRNLERFYFVFMGKNYRDSKISPTIHAHIMLSEELNSPIRCLEIASVLTIPRQLGLEFSLLKAVNQNKSIFHIRNIILNYMRKLAGNLDDVGPPYQFVIVSDTGIDIQCIDE